MMNLPSISILIPVYNVEKYIADCTKSVMAQTYTGKMECIIVDDCSTDNSITIAEMLIAEYQGPITFHILHHENNRGLAAARNTAVEAAQGDFIVHIDSDDWVEPTMIEELVAKQLETNADIVSCNAIAHYPRGEEILEEPNYASKDEMMRSLLQLTLDHVIWRRLIRTTLYKGNDIQAVEGVNIGEDHYTLPRLLFYAKSFAKCDEALYHYNCLNASSYIQSVKQSFNYPRYKSDVSSINILIDFFSKNDKNYLDLLYAIKAHYIYHHFFGVLKIGDKEAYNGLCADWKTLDDKYIIAERLTEKHMNWLSPSYYNINRVRVFARIIIKKTIGIKKYNL